VKPNLKTVYDLIFFINPLRLWRIKSWAAKIIGWISEAGKRLNFDDEGFALCEKSGKKYRLADERVTEI